MQETLFSLCLGLTVEVRRVDVIKVLDRKLIHFCPIRLYKGDSSSTVKLKLMVGPKAAHIGKFYPGQGTCLPQVEVLMYLGVLFITNGRMD